VSYRVSILRRAQKELADLPNDIFLRVSEALQSLAMVPRPSGCVKLRGREGWRIRVGNYRVLYKIDDDQQIVTIVHVGHRKDVYD